MVQGLLMEKVFIGGHELKDKPFTWQGGGRV